MIDAGTTMPVRTCQHPSLYEIQSRFVRRHTANTQSGQDQQSPELVKVVHTCDGQRATASGHQDRRSDEQFLIVASQHRQQPQYDAGTCQDAETDGDSADTNTNRVVSVDVESLRRPEHEDGEEVGAGDERDDERETKDPRFLTQTLGEHWVLRAICFPQDKCDDESGA
jgi:hypothetical protein